MQKAGIFETSQPLLRLPLKQLDLNLAKPGFIAGPGHGLLSERLRLALHLTPGTAQKNEKDGGQGLSTGRVRQKNKAARESKGCQGEKLLFPARL